MTIDGTTSLPTIPCADGISNLSPLPTVVGRGDNIVYIRFFGQSPDEQFSGTDKQFGGTDGCPKGTDEPFIRTDEPFRHTDEAFRDTDEAPIRADERCSRADKASVDANGR